MYVPGLSRRLFSITRFAKHGHFATIRNGSTTFYFGCAQAPVTLTSKGGHPMAADVTVRSLVEKPHLVPCNHSHDHSANKRRISLDFLHQQLGHRKCRAILAASEHDMWDDTLVCMGPEQDCISCDISTIRASARNKQSYTGSTYAGEYIFMDILHPVVSAGLTKDSTYAFHLILVDAYSRYVCIYGLPDKTCSSVIDCLTRHQAEHGHTGNYGYLDIARIRADAGSQFTSLEFKQFKQHCWTSGRNISLAAPKKQHQNHLVERTWQSVSTMARSLLVHARLSDSFMYLALLYSCATYSMSCR
jgi:transposase InsO family protein